MQCYPHLFKETVSRECLTSGFSWIIFIQALVIQSVAFSIFFDYLWRYLHSRCTLGVNDTDDHWENFSNRGFVITCRFSDYSPSLCRLILFTYDMSFYTVIPLSLCPIYRCSGCSRAEISMYTISLFRLLPCINIYVHYVPVQAVPEEKYLFTLCPCSGCSRAEIFIYAMSLFRLSSCINIYVHYVPVQAVPGLQAGVPPLQLGVLPPVSHGLLQVWLRGQR